MKDIKYILLFSVIGVVVAYLVSGPLRRPESTAGMVGTPLHSENDAPPSSPLYAQGTISIENGVAAGEAMNRTLFIIARSPAGGAPIAVKKMDAPSFPLEFSLGPESNMFGTDFFEGDLVIVARLDKDGAAGPKQPDDWEGSVSVASGGSRRVNINIRP